jgi:proline iminopeptidase
MHDIVSLAQESDWKYPEPDAMTAHGWLPVDSGHRIYWHEYGTSDGQPVMFLHGGPGGGTKPKQARFFNPRRYRIILFDQRGCGKSEPNAGDKDPRRASAAFRHNTTPDLINDIEALRKHLHIKEPMHVFGGSWGSTLALAYAIARPESVKTLILRGIFLCRRKDIDYFYQGNAASYRDRPDDTSIPGAYLFYPEAWKKFVEVIDHQDRGDMAQAYARIFNGPPGERLENAAKAWSVWEGVTSNLVSERDTAGYEDSEFAKMFARIENHYFMAGAFLGGASNRDNNYLLENVSRIAHLPIYVVQGRFDQVCPRFQADELVAALKKANPNVKLDYRLTTAGHSQYEKETASALTSVMDSLSWPVGPAKTKT